MQVSENVERADIKEIQLVYLNDVYACAEGDVVIAYGHGGDDNVDLRNNQGRRVKPNDVIQMWAKSFKGNRDVALDARESPAML